MKLIKFHENPLSGFWIVVCREADEQTGRHGEHDGRILKLCCGRAKTTWALSILC